MKTPEQQIEMLRKQLDIAKKALSVLSNDKFVFQAEMETVYRTVHGFTKAALEEISSVCEAPPQPARKAREFIVTDETDNSGYSIREMTENEKWFFKEHHLLSACNSFVVREVLE